MASSFDRWEKDPFFSAAEEVQESADRMESTYRTFVHAKNDAANEWNLEELQRDLHTVVGTTKWQLEEFEQAVRSSYIKDSTDDAKSRHRDFIAAIEDQVSKVQNSLHGSSSSEGKNRPTWVHLDEGESNELALFLASLPTSDGMKKPSHLSEKPNGHRRTVSANADIDAWKIAIPPDDSYLQPNLSNGHHPPLPPQKIPSVSSFLNSTESSTSNSKWLKNGFRKLKALEVNQESSVPRPSQPDKGTSAFYERSKSCLDSCDDSYNKQLYGWYGAVQRRLQRSQYQMQYSRPAQLTLSAFLLCLIVFLAFQII